MSEAPDNQETMYYRLGRVEKAVEGLEDKKADRDFVDRIVASVEHAVSGLGEEVRGLRHVIIGAAMTATVTAIVTCVTLVIAHV